MSTARCATCKRDYWRYDGSYRGYCSFACFSQRKRRKQVQPEWNQFTCLEAMRMHRTEAHGTPDIIPWYDCEVCERLEERYARAVA